MRFCFGLLALLFPCGAQEPADFRASVELVPVTLAVTGPDGQPVLNMRKEEFVLLDNGKERPIQYLWHEADAPLTVGLVIDISGSQAGFVAEHRETVAAFLKQVLRPRDQAFLVAVASGVKLVTDVTHSFAALEQGVDLLKPWLGHQSYAEQANLGEQCPAFLPDGSPAPPAPGGRRPRPCGTMLWNAVYAAARLKTTSVSGRKALVILTDGADAGSTHTLTEAIEASQRADTVVYTIHYSPAANPRKRPLFVKAIEARMEHTDRERLRRLSEETGGRAYDDPKGDPAAIFAEIDRDLRSLYVLAFKPGEEAHDGKFHRLEVNSRRADVRVRARKGYTN